MIRKSQSTRPIQEIMSFKINQICLKCSAAFAFLLLLQPAFAQPDFSEVDGLLQKNQKMLSGSLSMLIAKDGKVVHEKDFGEFFNAKTQAPIGQVSQWLTAALVMTFVDQGKISLDDPVSRYLPIMDKYAKSYITIRDCLAHANGIAAEAGGLGKIVSKKKFETLEDEANYFISHREIATNPGTEIFFSEIGPCLAGRVLEVVSKRGFDRLMQERILRPLKMHRSTFTDFNGRAVSPFDGGQMTTEDLLNFFIMLLNKGVYGDKRILSEASVRELETAQFTSLPVKFVPPDMSGSSFGLGNWIDDADHKGSGHVFYCPGMMGAYAWIDTCRNYAAVILPAKPVEGQKKEFFPAMREAVGQLFPGGGCE